MDVESGSFSFICQGSQRQRPFYGRGQGSNYGSRLNSYVGMGNQSWIGVDSTRGRGRVTDPSLGGGYNGNYDILNEQNRGPRALKPKTQVSEELDSSADSKKHNKDSPKEESNNNNNPEFVTDYSEAKLFIIKSYSEDNVHKSIKYNVWASTPNGNKKLDAAYREAKEEKEACPVFLLFSVRVSNPSAVCLLHLYSLCRFAYGVVTAGKRELSVLWSCGDDWTCGF